jgi:hypothetical protein
MSTNRATNEEGLQAEFLKHGIRSLESYIVDLFNHVVCSGFPPLGQDTLFIQSTNQGVVPIQTTIGLSWWVTHSPSFMPQSYTNGSLRSWRVDILELEDKQVSAQTTRRLITSSHSEPLLRRLVIALRRFTVAL